MTWGRELWDRTQEVAAHLERGIDGCERLRLFLKERCLIETEYAARLKRLIKGNLVVAKKGKSIDEDLPFTWQKAFQGMVNEVNDLATQHERLAELVQDHVIKPLDETMKTSKETRKRISNDVTTAENKYKQSRKQLELVQDKYRKAYALSVQSEQNYERADKDLNMSRAQIDKIKNDMIRRRQESDDAKKDYAAQLAHFNDEQAVHYTQIIPSFVNQLEDLEVKRITAFRDYLQRSNDSEKDVLKIMMKCLDGIDNKLAAIDANRDNQLICDQMKTGYPPPTDLPFEDLSSTNPTGNLQSTKVAQPAKDLERKRSRSVSKGAFDTKRSFGDMPPHQQKNELNKKLNQLRDDLAKKSKELDGVQKLEQSYRQNPKLGNADVLREQMMSMSKVIEGLNAEIREYEGYLVEAEARLANARSTITDNSAMRKSSAPTPDPRATYTVGSAGSYDPSNVRGSRPIPSAPAHQQSIDDEFSVGKAVALYPYEANDASALSIQAHEVLHVIEADTQSTGWTRVRRGQTAEEGFVPTAYLKIDFF